jgi:hypothetical protein
MAQAESTQDRFKRLAEARVTKTIKDIRLIANLSNRNNYSYSAGDIEKIFKTLDRELKSARSRFEGERGDDGVRFSL